MANSRGRLQYGSNSKLCEQHQGQLHLFLLDPMDIKDIANQSSLSGKILYEDSAGKRQVVLENIVVSKEHFKIIYFDELPLSLEKTPR